MAPSSPLDFFIQAGGKGAQTWESNEALAAAPALLAAALLAAAAPAQTSFLDHHAKDGNPTSVKFLQKYSTKIQGRPGWPFENALRPAPCVFGFATSCTETPSVI